MQITPGMMQDLRRPFEPHEHEFLNGAAYIREDAITTRIEDVYPEWELTILDMRYRQTFGSDVQVTITVRLTIGGVSRDGVGSAKVIGKTTAWANNKKTPLPPEDHSEVNEAEKSAATDALKRAARLFGIGRYLLSLPDTVKDEASLAKYLNGNTPPTLPKQAATAPKQGKPASTGATTIAESPEQATSDTPLRAVLLTAVTVEKSETTGNRRMRFVTADNLQSVFSWTRQPFISGGWCDDRDWLEPNIYSLPAPAPAKVKWNATESGGYWTVESVDPFQPDFLTEGAR